MSQLRYLLLSAMIIGASGGCMNPRIQANIVQSMNDITNELNAQRQDMSLLQEQIDSLKFALAHQDTVIKRLINITGLPPGGFAESSGAPSTPGLRYFGAPERSEHRLRQGEP
jgi:hypothetical protein